MIISFNDYIGFETINKEYKEFTFNCAGINIDNKLAEKYCYNNNFKFNEDVLENLKKYIKVYLPKYACSFWNSKIQKSKFYIGVNDFGLVVKSMLEDAPKPKMFGIPHAKPIFGTYKVSQLNSHLNFHRLEHD
jgi:hypothetical protein